ncbi:MAG: hypothetical protein PWP68_1325 [Rikenellaceae bacterium]|jgi:hypothetical protein|nr:hypothetical protein [Rikenellaceae bacterium]
MNDSFKFNIVKKFDSTINNKNILYSIDFQLINSK